jgi:hypothetical protein
MESISRRVLIHALHSPPLVDFHTYASPNSFLSFPKPSGCVLVGWWMRFARGPAFSGVETLLKSGTVA